MEGVWEQSSQGACWCRSFRSRAGHRNRLASRFGDFTLEDVTSMALSLGATSLVSLSLAASSQFLPEVRQ